MTNEEAANVLRIMASGIELKGYTDLWLSSFKEAYEMAIKALETGEVYMTGEDYNLYIEGYKAGKRDFGPKQGEQGTSKND